MGHSDHVADLSWDTTPWADLTWGTMPVADVSWDATPLDNTSGPDDGIHDHND